MAAHYLRSDLIFILWHAWSQVTIIVEWPQAITQIMQHCLTYHQHS